MLVQAADTLMLPGCQTASCATVRCAEGVVDPYRTALVLVPREEMT